MLDIPPQPSTTSLDAALLLDSAIAAMELMALRHDFDLIIMSFSLSTLADTTGLEPAYGTLTASSLTELSTYQYGHYCPKTMRVTFQPTSQSNLSLDMLKFGASPGVYTGTARHDCQTLKVR